MAGFLSKLLGRRETPDDVRRRLFLCDTPADIDKALSKTGDETLIAAFKGIDMASIPFNTFCKKYYTHPRGTDSRIITLAIALAKLAKENRGRPSSALAETILPKFKAKVERGPSQDRSLFSPDEWQIHPAVKEFLLPWAKELMKEGVDRNEWALAILDAITTDWPTDDSVLFWRAAAAYNWWSDHKKEESMKTMARDRMTAFLDNGAHRTMDARSVNMIREFRDSIR
ncbi:MAG: hypothetical protein ABSF37_05425 [Sedimentisphaerales bacterium]|jgi:hypothetical protein